MRALKIMLLLVSCFATAANAQYNNAGTANLVYVDKSGVLRYTKTAKEAAFFGVNYTVPFAYGYRSHKALRKDVQKAIDEDVYHFARLGLDAFRVHVWDTEISDSLGNLKANAHLKLFDYLLSKLKERGIKILVTPLAFWGNGYPEPDEKTGSFSSIYNKQQVLVTEAAIKAQENYLKQFLAHVNSYTKQTYGTDNDVIALEINNEPHHSGTKKQAADYIARMVAAVKSSGWTKPVFYNISESPTYAAAVANSNIDGVSFQWYPTGLVSGHILQGNFLPNVDVYKIPFDTIPAYKTKARAVYEFDAGDVLASYMYPAMARSFRTAGFQWATQFAYDPMATAYANTEYQTHYLNLAYTPSKAISLLIAAKAFHQLPRLQSYGSYPDDSIFKAFRVSYTNALSEMNSDTAFYYSNTTGTTPSAISKLRHIAGVGSSPVVQYSGSGAYFLDKLSNGAWRLEVMPDAIFIRDPFEKASPQKEVTRIEWSTQNMQLFLPELAQNFFISPLNAGNHFQTQAGEKGFPIKPGTYVISNKKMAHGDLKKAVSGAVLLAEFAAPPAAKQEPAVRRQPLFEIPAGHAYLFTATIAGIDSTDTVSMEWRHAAKGWKTAAMQRSGAHEYKAALPEQLQAQGILNYRIIIRKKEGLVYTFPGGYKGDPYAWNAYEADTYETFIKPANAPLSLYNAAQDRTNTNVYNPDWRTNAILLIPTAEPGVLALNLVAGKQPAGSSVGFQIYVGSKLNAYAPALKPYDELVLNIHGTGAQKVNVALITKGGTAFSKTIVLDTTTQNQRIPLRALQADSALLLPRPYPGFMPLYFKPDRTENFDLGAVDKLQVSLLHNETASGPASVELISVTLQNSRAENH